MTVCQITKMHSRGDSRSINEEKILFPLLDGCGKVVAYVDYDEGEKRPNPW